MAILIDEKTQVVVQGITGREGRLRANLMIDGGTNVVAGVTPGRGGEKFRERIPIFDTASKSGSLCGLEFLLLETEN